MDTNYFVCTLGETEHVSDRKPFPTVCHLIAGQAADLPNVPAVGFYRVHIEAGKAPALDHEVFTFQEVHRGVLAVATQLSIELHTVPQRETIGLLCSSSAEFLFLWLACVWLCHPVLIIAPDCTASGIAQLCQNCAVTTLLTDTKNEKLARDATRQTLRGEKSQLRCVKPSLVDRDIFANVRNAVDNIAPAEKPQPDNVAYLHHTSGTSSGQPKPIPQTHRGAVGALPRLKDLERATFTTTPLYHGGPADIIRAWTSDAMIWLFPSRDIPITPTNVVACLQCAKSAAEKNHYPSVTFFASVPYILDAMSEDDDGLRWLQYMELVGVGGASLSEATGLNLISNDVRLVSRYGSAECGFLLSSHRNYDDDTAWQYLRVPASVSSLRFEDQGDGLSQLVVLPSWPHRAKINREDGSFATSDLFEPHPRIPNAWKFHSRADAQLTLVTGKKFDPESMERRIESSAPQIAEALVFGNGRPYPGLLMARASAAADLSDDEFVEIVFPILERLNLNSPVPARIPQNMLVPLPHSDKPFKRSSKGTILRKQTENLYSERIESAYMSDINTGAESLDESEISHAIRNIVRLHLPANADLDDDSDLFSLGIDSMTSLQIKRRLQHLLPKHAPRLSGTTVEDCGSIRKLSEYISRLQCGESSAVQGSKAADHSHMRELVKQFGRFSEESINPTMNGTIGMHTYQRQTVLLTGATGFLGAHILDQLARDENVSKVFCIVRPSGPRSAHERLKTSLQQRRLSTEWIEDDSRFEVIEAKLSDERLGIDQNIYNHLAQQVTVIIHAAWSVNFRRSLTSFVQDIASVRNLINLARSSTLSACPKFVFCSSVASVQASSKADVPECIDNDPSSAGTLGYSQSKWVAEQICHHANLDHRMAGRISILRIGQLSASRKTGIWNSKEAWPIMLSTVALMRSLPNLKSEVLHWLPVDVAASAVVQVAVSLILDGEVEVLHILNDSSSPIWSDLLGWLSKEVSFSAVSISSWLQQLETSASDSHDHPAYHLIDHWKQQYLNEKEPMTSEIDKASKRSPFSMTKSKVAIPALRELEPVNEAYFNKIWNWIEGNMLPDSNTK